MGDFLIILFSVLLILTSGFVVLVILMQKPSANAGMGSALGGGAAESAFGGQAGNILTRGTILGAVVFFVLTFALYLGYMVRYESSKDNGLPGSFSALSLEESEESEQTEPIEESVEAISDELTTRVERVIDEAKVEKEALDTIEGVEDTLEPATEGISEEPASQILEGSEKLKNEA